MTSRRGSNQYITKYRHNDTILTSILAVMFVTALGILIIEKAHAQTKIVSPLPDTIGINVYPKKVEKTVDQLVDEAANKYGTTPSTINRIKVLTHFLLLRESGYGSNKGCGDSGKACGPLQFHEPTYIAYRKIMMKRGFVSHMGSRLNMADAIETTAWAISDGREKAWGPILRGEIVL